MSGWFECTFFGDHFFLFGRSPNTFYSEVCLTDSEFDWDRDGFTNLKVFPTLRQTGEHCEQTFIAPGDQLPTLAPFSTHPPHACSDAFAYHRSSNGEVTCTRRFGRTRTMTWRAHLTHGCHISKRKKGQIITGSISLTIGSKHKYDGARSLVQKLPFSFTNNQYRWPSLYAVFLSAILRICNWKMAFFLKPIL